MKSLRRGLWDGEVGKDARGRFSCRICHQVLVVRSDGAEEVEQIDDGEFVARSCPECGRAWQSRAAVRRRTTGG